MANDFVNIKGDAAPTKKLASQSFTRTGPGTVHQEEIVIGDGVTDGRIVTVTAANALKVDNSAITQPVSGTVTTTPPANASTNVAQYGGTGVTLGQKVMASSEPVVIASDQSVIPVNGD